MRIKKTVKKHNNNTSKKSTTLKKHLRTQKGGGQLLDVINNNELSGEEIYKQVKQLLQNNDVDVDETDDDGTTALTNASSQGRTDVVQALIAAGADKDKSDNDGETPILYASYNGHLEVVQALIAAGADVNKAEVKGGTPLFAASGFGHLEVVQALIAAGADVNKAVNNGVTPLYVASREGRVDIVRVLLERGADITKTFNKKTPLMIAEKKGHMAVVQLLEVRGYDTEMESESEVESVEPPRRSTRAVKRRYKNLDDNQFDNEFKKPSQKQQRLEQKEQKEQKKQRLEQKEQKHRNQIAYSGKSIDTLYNEMYDLVEDLNSKVLNIDGREVPIEYLNKQGLDKLTEDIFPAALVKLQEMVNSFSRDIDNSADIQIESDISTLVKDIQGINYKDIVEGEGTRSTGHNKLIKLLFDEKLYLKGKGIDYRKFFEPSNTGTQCYNMFGSNWQDTKDCYICGVRKANQKEKFHCEHVLNIYQAAVTTGLYYNGMEKDEMSHKLKGLGLNEFTATTREKDEIKTEIEDDKDDLKNTVYDVACSCCNSIKTNYMFIDFDSSKWEWIVDTDGIDKVFRGILENSTDICKHINKKTIVRERGPEIYENLQSRCEILNDFFLPPNPVNLGNKQRQRYYNLLTLSNLLITFRPKNLQKLIKKIMKGGRDMNVIPQQTVFPDMGDMGNKIMEYETNIGKKDTVVNNEEPKINQANETLKQTIIKLVQDDLDERQQKLDTFFEYFEKSVAQYQKEHPEVIQGRKEFDEIIKNNPDAFKDGRPNPTFWLNRNKTGGKKTKKRRNTRTKPKKTVRKTKKNTRNKK